MAQDRIDGAIGIIVEQVIKLKVDERIIQLGQLIGRRMSWRIEEAGEAEAVPEQALQIEALHSALADVQKRLAELRDISALTLEKVSACALGGGRSDRR